MRGRNVRYIGVDESVWHLHGEMMGQEGVWLTSLAGFYHPVRVPIMLTPAYMRGAIPGDPKTDVSRIGMKIFTSANSALEWEGIESQWWNAWSDEKDGGFLEVENLSAPETGSVANAGTRRLPVRLERWPEDPFDYEPEEEMDWTMPVISYSPGWQGVTLTSSYIGTGLGSITMANPGDLEGWPHFTGEPVDGTILPDGIDGNGVDVGVVPLPEMDPAEGDWLVVTDQMEVPIENTADTQIAARLAGLLFKNPIPPGTDPVAVPITTGTATTVRFYLTPLYRRPWG